MSASHDRYICDLNSAHRHNVSAKEFEEAALNAGWQARNVELFVKRPWFSGYVLVGLYQALRIIDD